MEAPFMILPSYQPPFLARRSGRVDLDLGRGFSGITTHAPSATSRHDTSGQRLDVRADVARTRQPHAVRAPEDVLERLPEPADPVWPPGDERMERDRAHERLARRLLEHLVELVDDQVGELVRGVVVPDDPARIVHLDRVWHGEDSTLARADPDGLVVHRPVHRVPV